MQSLNAGSECPRTNTCVVLSRTENEQTLCVQEQGLEGYECFPYENLATKHKQILVWDTQKTSSMDKQITLQMPRPSFLFKSLLQKLFLRCGPRFMERKHPLLLSTDSNSTAETENTSLSDSTTSFMGESSFVRDEVLSGGNSSNQMPSSIRFLEYKSEARSRIPTAECQSQNLPPELIDPSQATAYDHDDPWMAAKRGDLTALQAFQNVDWTQPDAFNAVPLYYGCHSGAARDLRVVPFLLHKWPQPTLRYELLDRCQKNAINKTVVKILNAYSAGKSIDEILQRVEPDLVDDLDHGGMDSLFGEGNGGDY